jgi:hypothetical protein
MTETGCGNNEQSREGAVPMTYEYDFEMVKRAYAEMARRAREKDEVRRLPRTAPAQTSLPREAEPCDRQASTV